MSLTTPLYDNLLYAKHHWQYSYRHADDVFQHEPAENMTEGTK